MINVSCEAPLAAMYSIKPYLDYEYILAHLVKRSQPYSEYMKASNKPKYLDNSAFELGSPMTGEQYSSIINEYRPNYYYIPDYFDNTAYTITNYSSWMKTNRNGICVLQGKTMAQVEATFLEATRVSNFIAIPYAIKAEYNGDILDRYEVIKYLLDMYGDRFKNLNVHLLGIKNMEELKNIASLITIESVDTSYPVFCGLYGINHKIITKIDWIFDINLSSTEINNIVESVKRFVNEVKELQ